MASTTRSARLRGVTSRPVLAFLAWFGVVGWAILFVPVLSARGWIGTALPLEPFVPAATLLGLLAPAFVLTTLLEGRAGVRALWRRVTRWRVSWRLYAAALLLLPVASLALAVIAAGAPQRPAAGWPAFLAAITVDLLLGFLVINLWEETAWMGFVQAWLQERRGPWSAAFLTGVLFATGHLPLLLLPGQPSPLLLLPLVIVVALPFRALLAWLYNRGGHSLLLVGLAHAAFNTANGGRFLPPLFPDATTVWVAPTAVIAIGGALLLVTRGRLGLERAAVRPSADRLADPGRR